jgi:hypothetical protein
MILPSGTHVYGVTPVEVSSHQRVEIVAFAGENDISGHVSWACFRILDENGQVKKRVLLTSDAVPKGKQVMLSKYFDAAT